ncbi:MAG: dihydroorotase [Lachnospiraceae bacterium]|nr:dihydroorotase [Lachnospiraceae bacterium]
MENTLLIRGGYVVDPGTDFEGYADVLVRDGFIADVSEHIEADAGRIFDAEGLTVFPGLVDLHVHLRDPGQTHKEDLETGAAAAARGGVTSLVAMPNTTPPVDSAELARDIAGRAAELNSVHIFQASSITAGMKGQELVDIEGLMKAGTRVFSEDGKSVMNASLMRAAMKRIAACGGLILDHCEDISMVEGGVINAGAKAESLGLPGITNSVEDVIAVRDVILAAETGVKFHLCHCSTRDSVRIVREAKKAGVRVSAEVCPHHFTLTDDDIPGDDANYKMNPPLRGKADVEALRAGIADGTIECISTDHAPHAAEEKSRGFLKAPFGIVGLETSAALTYTELVRGGVITLMEMAKAMSFNPARILGVSGGTLTPGAPADIAVFDFGEKYRIDPDTFASKGKNTPFAGREVYGKTRLTVVGGLIVWEAGQGTAL